MPRVAMAPARPALFTLALITLALAAGSAHAQTLHRCLVNGQPTFQDRPCADDGLTGTQVSAQRERQMQRLDQLQAQGAGMINRDPSSALAQQSTTPRPASTDRDGPRHPRLGNHSDEWYAQQREEELKRRNADSQARNNQTMARMAQSVEGMRRECGHPMTPRAEIGMSDETFRMCTTQGRFGAVTQVVAADDQGVPLRLYVYPNPPARRVYSVGGVIVRVQP